MSAMRNIWRIFRTAILDLRGGYRDFYIMSLSVLLGVTLISSIQMLSRNIDNDLRYNGRYILGGDIAIRTIGEPISDEQMKFLRHLGVVSVVMETRAVARREDGQASLLVELKAVDPFYPPYGRVNFVDESGKRIMFPDDKGSIREAIAQDMILPKSMEDFEAGRSLWGVAVEKEILSRLNLHIGDILMLGRQKFRIRGIIDSEPDKLGSSKFTVFPRILMSYYTIEDTGLSEEGGRIYYDHRIIMPQIRSIEDLQEATKKIEAEYPNANWQGRTFLDAAPAMRQNIEAFNLLFMLFSFVAMLVGGIGIATSVRSYLQKKYKTIATFKTLGISAKKIFWIYFIQILIMAIPTIIVSIALSVAILYLFLPLIAEALSLESKILIYPDILALSSLFGLTVVAMFMLVPILNASKIKVASLFRHKIEVISNKVDFKQSLILFVFIEILILLIFMMIKNTLALILFVIGACILATILFIFSFFTKKIVALIRPRGKPALRLALTNLYRPANITTSAFISTGIVLTVMIALLGIESNFKTSLKRYFEQDTPSFYIMDIKTTAKTKIEQAIKNFEDISNYKFIPIIKAKINDSPNYVDISYMQDNLLNAELLDGKWWDKNSDDNKDNTTIKASIDSETANINQIKLGDEIKVTILDKDFTAIIGNIRKNTQNSFSPSFPLILSIIPNNLDINVTYMATVNINDSNKISFQNYLAELFPTIIIVRTKEAFKSALDLTEFVSNIIKIGIFIITIIAILVLQGGIMAGQYRQIYDTTILKILGINRSNIAKVFLLEYGILSLVIGISSLILGVFIANGISIFLLNIETNIVLELLIAFYIVVFAIFAILLLGYLNIKNILFQNATILLRKSNKE